MTYYGFLRNAPIRDGIAEITLTGEAIFTLVGAPAH